MKQIFKTLVVMCLPAVMWAQSAKVQTAWRQLQDYQTSKDVSSLMKAKEAIDLATNHENTKNEAKTWSYRSQVYYALFKNALEQEEKKLAATVPDKNERLTKAYGNVSTVDLEESGKALEKLQQLDKDLTYFKTPEMMKMGYDVLGDVNNLAVGKYNTGKYAEAAEYFESSYMSTKMMGRKDTASLTNALVCAQKAKDVNKVKEYNEKIMAEKLATPYNYISLYDAKMQLKDSAGATKTLNEGRQLFPNDIDLLNRETDIYLQSGRDAEAQANLDKAIQKSPNSGILYLARGNIYDKQANPKDAAGKEKDKPKNYEELMTKAETDYKKASELDPKNSDAWYNMGALYNGWANTNIQLCDNLIKQAAKMKECEAKATEKYMKAITSLEKVLELNPGDKSTMKYLHKLYIRTEQNDKANKIKEQIDKK